MLSRALLIALAIGATALSAPVVQAQTYQLLLAESEAEQARVLRSLVNSSGNPCSEVTTILFNGADEDGAGYWAVACADGNNWMVQVKNDDGGSSSVTSCAILAAVNIKCWEPF